MDDEYTAHITKARTWLQSDMKNVPYEWSASVIVIMSQLCASGSTFTLNEDTWSMTTREQKEALLVAFSNVGAIFLRQMYVNVVCFCFLFFVSNVV